jgi:hypothetical protein
VRGTGTARTCCFSSANVLTHHCTGRTTHQTYEGEGTPVIGLTIWRGRLAYQYFKMYGRSYTRVIDPETLFTNHLTMPRHVRHKNPETNFFFFSDLKFQKETSCEFIIISQ